MIRMDRNTTEAYKRGARFVVPAFVIACVYAGVRIWVLTRQPKIEITLDEDAMAQSVVAYCDSIGWDAGPCAEMIVADP